MLNKTKHNMSLRRSESCAAYAFLLPWLVGLVLFTAYPFLNSLYLSFTDATVAKASFIGLHNYIELLTDDGRFIKSLINTTKYAVISVPLKLAFALFVAILLKNGRTFYRTVYYIPSIIGGSIAVAVMWRQMFSMEGVFNAALAWFHVPPREWLGHPDYALSILILLAVWQFGSSMVIFIGGLKNIPNELYEAASIDGAGKFHSFFNITLPMLSPTIHLILQLIGAFQVFTQGYIITQGGPMDETLFTVHYIYEMGFKSVRLGYASAASWVLLALIAVVAGVVFFTSKYWVFYENEK
ncbi:MAG: sugar ABC transporter permease [Ruthenibacterium sp.]